MGREGDAPLSRRRARELRTLLAMVTIHCRDRHGGDEQDLCDECAVLAAYATRRLSRCVFGDDKPTCANCTVHCYSAPMREAVRTVMRYAGPRMIYRHPLLAIAHVRDGRRRAPGIAEVRPQRAPRTVAPAQPDSHDP